MKQEKKLTYGQYSIVYLFSVFIVIGYLFCLYHYFNLDGTLPMIALLSGLIFLQSKSGIIQHILFMMLVSLYLNCKQDVVIMITGGFILMQMMTLNLFTN